MASLETRLRDGFTRAGTEFKSVRAAIAANATKILELVGLLDNKQDALGFVPENTSMKGVANGYAGLDIAGRVPASQLPAFVDDVTEVADETSLPQPGVAGVLYVTLDTGKIYRWSGTQYAEIVAAPGSTDAITEGVNNLYFTTARANAALDARLGNTDTNFVEVFEAGLV